VHQKRVQNVASCDGPLHYADAWVRDAPEFVIRCSHAGCGTIRRRLLLTRPLASVLAMARHFFWALYLLRPCSCTLRRKNCLLARRLAAPLLHRGRKSVIQPIDPASLSRTDGRRSAARQMTGLDARLHDRLRTLILAVPMCGSSMTVAQQSDGARSV
jgi:hypothetical protein